MNVLRMSSVAVLTALVLFLASCITGPTERKAPEGKVLLQGAGASFPNPLYQKWAASYAEAHADVVIQYQSVGSGKGIERFLEGSVDFGASDRAMSDKQIDAAKRGALLVPTAAGMVALAYHPEGLPDGLRLPRDVYADIILGKIMRWNDPRIQATLPKYEFPDKAITVVVRQDSSGTTFAFTNHLAAIHPEWKAGPGVGTTIQWPCAPLRAPGNEGVVAMIQRTPYAIGYAEYGQATRLGLRMATLENQSKQFVAPIGGAGLKALLNTDVPDNFRVFLPDPAGEDSYPIITYTWILAHAKYGDAKKASAVREFLEWSLTEGQKDCEALGYVPLPSAVARRAVETVRKIQE